MKQAEFFEFEMTDDDFDAAAAAQMLGQLFGQIDRAMLAASAAEPNQ